MAAFYIARMGDLAQLLGSLSADDRQRGSEFEDICAWLLQHSTLYQPFVRKVWRWQDWPGRWGGDSGIDLVVETHNEELWAVQAKAYDPSYYLKKADIDSFLSESSRPCFAFRLLIATTDLVGPRAESALRGQSVPVGRLLRADLEDLAIDWPATHQALAPTAAQSRVEPHEAAERALRDIVAGLAAADRGQAVMACGTGKTLVGLWTAERMSAQSVLVLLPSLSLLSQTMREWTHNWTVSRRVAAVCSDASVSDSSVATVSELPVPVTTDAQELSAFLALDEPIVVFSTYQSASVVVEACALSQAAFDLLLADEAHRCAGPVSGRFALATDADALPATKRLFMTATPRIYTQRVKKAAEDDEFGVLSMDDEARFGRVLHRLTFGVAVEQDLLSDYEVVITGVTNQALSDAIQRRRLVQAEGLDQLDVLDARTLASLTTVVRASEKYQLRRTVTFHSRVAAARAFSERLPVVASWLGSERHLSASYVSGQMSSGQRRSRLLQLAEADQERPRVLANARCLTEGVNVPNLDAVAFIDPRESQIDIVQAVGRVMRKSPDKTVGRIILPVFVAERETHDDLRLDQSEFATVWKVIRALRAHDDTLAEELDEIRREIGRWGSGASRLPDRVVLDLPATYTPEMLMALTLRVLEATAQSWSFMFGLLERFVAREGHARPRANHVENDATLGTWVTRQRSLNERGRLSSQRRLALEALPGWSWDPLEDSWQDFFALLLEFVAREGHARVPTAHRERGERLGRWVNLQRRTKFELTITAERESRLAALQGWSWNATRDEWLRAFSTLTEYVDSFGHANVHQGYVSPGGFALGRWVQERRKMKVRGTLSDPDEAALSAVPGWVWSRRRDEQTAKMDAMRAFCAREGHARVPGGHREGDVALGEWVRRCRRWYANGLLREDVREFLDSLPEWSWVERQRARPGPAEVTPVWRSRFEILEQYARKEGHTDVKQKHVEGDFALGRWVTTQRYYYRAGALHPDAIEALEALPTWTWDPQGDRWERGFERLERFAAEYGHCYPPAELEGGSPATWVREQRKVHRRGGLRPDLVARLEALPGWSWAYGPGGFRGTRN